MLVLPWMVPQILAAKPQPYAGGASGLSFLIILILVTELFSGLKEIPSFPSPLPWFLERSNKGLTFGCHFANQAVFQSQLFALLYLKKQG